MPQHEEEVCPRCQARFECKVGSINLCQCQTVSLDGAEMNYIRKKFDNCLCTNCLLELKKEHRQQLLEQKINRLHSFSNLKTSFKK